MFLHIKCLDKGIDKVVSGLQAIEILREIGIDIPPFKGEAMMFRSTKEGRPQSKTMRENIVRGATIVRPSLQNGNLSIEYFEKEVPQPNSIIPKRLPMKVGQLEDYTLVPKKNVAKYVMYALHPLTAGSPFSNGRTPKYEIADATRDAARIQKPIMAKAEAFKKISEMSDSAIQIAVNSIRITKDGAVFQNFEPLEPDMARATLLQWAEYAPEEVLAQLDSKDRFSAGIVSFAINSGNIVFSASGQTGMAFDAMLNIPGAPEKITGIPNGADPKFTLQSFLADPKNAAQWLPKIQYQVDPAAAAADHGVLVDKAIIGGLIYHDRKEKKVFEGDIFLLSLNPEGDLRLALLEFYKKSDAAFERLQALLMKK